MKTKLNKEQFAERVEIVISHRKALRKFFDTTFQELLAKYDGKQLNKRFKDELDAELKKISPLMFAQFEGETKSQYSNYPSNYTVCVNLCYRFEQFNYVDCESLHTNIVLDFNSTNTLRINAKMSQNEKYTVAWAQNFDKDTAEIKDAAKKFNKYLKVAEKMEAAVKEYESINFYFRMNIDRNYLPHIY